MGYTLKSTLVIKGTGIHSGHSCTVILRPQDKGGIYFKKKDNDKKVKLALANIKPQNLGTNLIKGDFQIKTIEHLIACLWFNRITDLLIELDSDEIPIMDGSALVFMQQIEAIGRKSTATKPRILRINTPIIFTKDESYIIALPSRKLSINYTINFPNVPLKTQNYIYCEGQPVNEIIPARTFGNIEDVEKLHASGRALGATMDNALVYNSKEYLNNPRFELEAVKHKILDLIGDMYASGFNVKGRIIAYKTGHVINNAFMKKIVRELPLI